MAYEMERKHGWSTVVSSRWGVYNMHTVPFCYPQLDSCHNPQTLSSFEISAYCYLDFTFLPFSLKFLLLGSVYLTPWQFSLTADSLSQWTSHSRHIYTHLYSIKLSSPGNRWGISASLMFRNTIKMSLLIFLWPWPEVHLLICCLQNIPHENIEQRVLKKIKPISLKYEEEIHNYIPLTDP